MVVLIDCIHEGKFTRTEESIISSGKIKKNFCNALLLLHNPIIYFHVDDLCSIRVRAVLFNTRSRYQIKGKKQCKAQNSILTCVDVVKCTTRVSFETCRKFDKKKYIILELSENLAISNFFNTGHPYPYHAKIEITRG